MTELDATIVDEWPQPVQWATYPTMTPDDTSVLGNIVGPMHLPGQADQYLTAVAVEGRRVGFTYGVYALRGDE